MVLPLFVFLKRSASQTGYQGGGHESRLPANEGYVFTLCSMPACRRHGAMFTRRSLGVGGPARSEPWRRWALLVLRSPAGRDVGGCGMLVSGSGTIER